MSKLEQNQVKNINVSDLENPVSTITHDEADRKMIPTTELAGEEASAINNDNAKAAYRTFKNDFDRSRDPELYWYKKYENDSEETQDPNLKIDIRSLYVHEDINPKYLIDKLYKITKQKKEGIFYAELFASEEPQSNLIDDEIERLGSYYQHSTAWKNRLIQGDSLLVMNSLLQRENMTGKVQCIYIDPPYGIKFGSNWQISLNSTSVKGEAKAENLSAEPEMIKAFRDTWELGIHSYLKYLRDRLVVARELLNETGSVFVQISDENVHLVRNILDEVFGSENFVSMITFRKNSPLGTTRLPIVADYIIWYAKNKEQMKYRQLVIDKQFGGNTGYKYLELEDGTRRLMTKEEREKTVKLPKNSKPYSLSDLSSSGYTASCMYDFEINGVTYKCGKKSWRTHKLGMQKLISLNRIVVLDNTPKYLLYHEDYPVQQISNLWDNIGSTKNKLYVCQTSAKPIQRCILMTTDPGDLVLDPTCGSGTTAFVAEQWGRRWITIDTSRIAINIAKKRLMSAKFDYFKLYDKEGGDIRQGFEYKTVMHRTAESLANDTEPEYETLYDQPIVDNKKMRVCGPFTVETLQSYNLVSPDDLDFSNETASEEHYFVEQVFSHLSSAGIKNGNKNEKAVFYNLERLSNPYLHARGFYKDENGAERMAYFLLGPKFGTISKEMVNKAISEFRSYATNEGSRWLVLLGFSFEDSIIGREHDFGNFTVSMVRMHDDLLQEGLIKKDKNAASFVTIGEPDICLHKNEDDNTFYVEICGLDIYDPIKDQVRERSTEDIAYWEIDDDYDGNQFFVRGIHFNGKGEKIFKPWKDELENQKKAIEKTKKSAEYTLKMEFEDELWEQLYGLRSESLPYVSGKKVAVRVVSQFGEECSKVFTLE